MKLVLGTHGEHVRWQMMCNLRDLEFLRSEYIRMDILLCQYT